MSPVWLRRWGPGIVAWGLTCGVPALFDWWATSRHPERPTQSRTLGHFLPHPIVGPALFGIWQAVGYHLFTQERLIAEAER